MKQPNAVFLDWDGTLVDSLAFLHGAHNHVRELIGRESFSLEEFRNYFGKPREQLYTDLYGDHREEAKSHFEAYVMANHLEQLKPMPGADDLVKTLNNMGIIAGVVSNKKNSFIQQEIRNFGWDPHFAAVIGAGDALDDKPAAQPLLEAVKRAGIKDNFDNIWFVGDTDIDLQCARNAGCISIFLQHGPESEGWIKEYKPRAVFKNCTEITEFLLQCAEK